MALKRTAHIVRREIGPRRFYSMAVFEVGQSDEGTPGLRHIASVSSPADTHVQPQAAQVTVSHASSHTHGVAVYA